MLRPFREQDLKLGWQSLVLLNISKQRALSTLAVIDDARRPRQCAINAGKKRSAGLTETVASPALDQRFQHFAIHGTTIDPLAHVRERMELAAFFACLQNRLHRYFADTLDRGQAESDH